MNYQVFMTYNTDSNGNRISENIYNEEYNIYSSRIVLNQIPDNFFGVSIENDSVPMVEIKNKSKELGVGEFFVDYATGLVRFNSALEGVTVMVTEYSGIGFISYPADRIYTKTNGTMISETLADLATNAGPVAIMLEELQDAEDLRVIAENSRISAEDTRISNENDRISAEDLRLSAEINRISSETDRLNAESSRLTNESTRISNENNRISEELDRLANEALRIPAENARLASETIRISSEEIRVDNEDIRISNESDRDSAESLRLSAEISRINSENTREGLESNRVLAEDIRITNENSRVDAESLRVTAETVRDDTETDRNTAETSRNGAEAVRVSNENTRINNEDTRIVSENERKQFKFLGDYDNGQQYLVRNTVLYNGSSYSCILDSLGNLPTDITYWTLVAERGNDGDMAKSVYDPSFIEANVFDMDSMIESTTKKILTDSERTQISLIAGKSDNGHTHTESDITDLQSYELSSNKGIANGYAELDSNGFVPSSQLPSYVDDVLSYANLASFPGTGENDKIYIAEDTNITYRWSGSAYVIIGTDLALGETENTAYRGDRGKTAYDHSQVVAGNPHGTTLSDLGYTGETDATADQTDVEIKIAYENNPDTNAYTDAEQIKMGYITVTQAVDLDNLSANAVDINYDNADSNLSAANVKAAIDELDTNVADRIINVNGVISFESGLLTNRPAPSTEGKVYIATDEGKMYRDNGTSWDTIGGTENIEWDIISNKPDLLLLSGGTMTGTIDMDQNSINNMVIENGTTFPIGAVQGQTFFNTDDNILYTYNGVGWDSNNLFTLGTLEDSETILIESNEWTFNIPGFVAENQYIFYLNGVRQAEIEDYTISGTTITKVDGNYLIDDYLSIVVYTTTRRDSSLLNKTLYYKNTEVLVSDTDTVAIGIPEFTGGIEEWLTVIQGGITLNESVDYTISGDKLSIVSLSGDWNTDTAFQFVLAKNVGVVNSVDQYNGTQIINGTISRAAINASFELDISNKAEQSALDITNGNVATNTDITEHITVTQAVNLDDMESDIDTFKEYGDIVVVTATGDILATYADKFLKCSNVITLTVQPNATIAFDIGTEITIFQYGTGKITIAEGSGVDIRSVDDALALDAQYSACTLKKIATDEWVLVGALA